MTSAAARTALVAAAVLLAVPALHAQPAAAREAVYFTTPNNKISRAIFASGTSQTAVTDNGTNFNGLAVRYDGNDVVTLLAANGTHGGDIRAYRCTSPTATCQALGVVTGFKKANGVARDALGNLYAVGDHQGGADPLLYLPRKLTCPTDRGTSLPPGCLPGGYGPAQTLVSQVPGVSLLADVKVEAGSGNAILLAAKPAMLLRYSAGTWSTIATNFSGQEPSGLALFPTGEIFVVTTQGSVFVFSRSTRNTFTTLNGQGQQIAIGIVGGTGGDPVANGRVLVTVKGANQIQSYGLQRVAGKLVAAPSVPEGTVAANVPFGVGDASLSGAVYTQASTEPVKVVLPAGHKVTFSKVNTGGITQGNYYILPEKDVREAATCTCPDGQMTIEGVTRCVPAHVRGFALNSTCQSDGTGCYYLVYAADSGTDVFGGTQEHHFEEDLFGFVTNCYINSGADPDPEQPRTFYATDDNDPAIVEGNEFTDISTGCGSHIGRGSQFSLFIAGRDDHTLDEAIEAKIASIETALDVETPRAAGGLSDYISPTGQCTFASLASSLRETWDDEEQNVTPGAEDYPLTRAALEAISAYVAGAASEFSECPLAALSCPAADKRNAPGEIVARVESAAFMACGASQDCQRTLP